MCGDFILKLARLISEDPNLTADGNPICEADVDMRDLERRAKMGDKEAADQLSRMKRRSGELPTVKQLLDLYSELVGDKPENFNKAKNQSERLIDRRRFEDYLNNRPRLLASLEKSLQGKGYKNQTLKKITRRVAAIWELLEDCYGRDRPDLHPEADPAQTGVPLETNAYMRRNKGRLKRMRQELGNMLRFNRPWANLGPRSGQVPGHLRNAFEHLYGEEPLGGRIPTQQMMAAMGNQAANPGVRTWTWFNYDTGEVRILEATSEQDMLDQAEDMGMELGDSDGHGGSGWDYIEGTEPPEYFTPQNPEDGWN